MMYRSAYEIDNRDRTEVYSYMEARIEALKRRIAELEAEREELLVTNGQRPAIENHLH